jgi:hypothetical protein
MTILPYSAYLGIIPQDPVRNYKRNNLSLRANCDLGGGGGGGSKIMRCRACFGTKSYSISTLFTLIQVLTNSLSKILSTIIQPNP